MKVHDENLPEHTYIERPTYELALLPGEEQRREVRALPRLRPIQILEEGGTLEERPGQRR